MNLTIALFILAFTFFSFLSLLAVVYLLIRNAEQRISHRHSRSRQNTRRALRQLENRQAEFDGNLHLVAMQKTDKTVNGKTGNPRHNAEERMIAEMNRDVAVVNGKPVVSS